MALLSATGTYAVPFTVVSRAFTIEDTDIGGALKFIIVGAESTRANGTVDWMEVRKTPTAWRNADDEWVQNISRMAYALDHLDIAIDETYMQEVNNPMDPAEIHTNSETYATGILYLVAFA